MWSARISVLIKLGKNAFVRGCTPIACAALLLGACQGRETVAPGKLDAALESISKAGIEAHLAYLADDALEGRMTGQPGYDAAARYVADRFRDMGLDPGGEDGWFQPVPLISYRPDEDSIALIAHRDGSDVELSYPDDFVAGGDKVRETNSVRAEVVFAGFGVHAPELGYSDFEGIDVDGKIIAILGKSPAIFPHNERAYYASSRTKAEEATRRGVVGVIGLRSEYQEQTYPWERIRAEAGSRPSMTWVDIGGHPADYFPDIEMSVTLSPDAAAGFFAGTPISFAEARAAGEAGRVASTPLGFEVSMSRRTRHERITSPNVIGIVRGSDPELANEFVVYSAHLDHLGIGVPVDGDEIYNGAYDNAIGVALLLETARAFAISPPRRSVLFIAVTGEERGLLGSDYFANYPTVPSESLIANVNLDMPLFLYPLADVVAFGAEHSSLEGIVRRALEAENLKLSGDPKPEETIFIRSDQYSFVRKGVPATFLVPGFESTDPATDGAALERNFRLQHYHRPSDDLGQPVHWESALRFARANVRIGTIVGNADERPAWNEGDFFGKRFAGR